MESLKLAKNIGLRNVQINLDSSVAINRINANEADLSYSSVLATMCRNEANFLDRVSFHFVGRQGHEPAHILARLGLNVDSVCNWGQHPPDDVITAANVDISNQ